MATNRRPMSSWGRSDHSLMTLWTVYKLRPFNERLEWTKTSPSARDKNKKPRSGWQPRPGRKGNKMEKPSIIEVLERYLPLRKAGKEYIGACPFHPDKIPSLSVNEDKGVFHCFGCGESGDVFDFLMKLN